MNQHALLTKLITKLLTRLLSRPKLLFFAIPERLISIVWFVRVEAQHGLNPSHRACQAGVSDVLGGTAQPQMLHACSCFGIDASQDNFSNAQPDFQHLTSV